jgi:NAD(P)-dependent dehydrogenase (short-subunit alcohol dehydrogenase family)
VNASGATGDRRGPFDRLVAVVTGGASGIGLATGRLLHQSGAHVTVLDLQSPPVESGLDGLHCDVRSTASVAAAIAAVMAGQGQLDLVINNAGVEARGGIADLDDVSWTRVLDVNVVGMARVVQAALPHLRESSAAAIVNTCSIAAVQGMAGLSLYSASKGAVLALTRALAAELHPDGIRVNCVLPGTVDTPWVQRAAAGFDDPSIALDRFRARQPDGRLIPPEEVAAAIAYLCDPRSASTTGTALTVDSGVTAVSNARRVDDPQ